MTKRKKIAIAAVVLTTVIAAGAAALYYLNMLPAREYSAEDFNIETVESPEDFNGNGRDDYADLILGARADAENHPKYDGRYWENAYPPDDIGVCTDVVWRAFKNAGYSLRDMVDRDIAKRPEAYPNIEKADNNIDFRRVVNLKIFFDEYAQTLTTDTSDIAQWQPGDIVIFKDDKHIGIVSDKRNCDGVPYIIHNAGQPKREEDYLKRATVTSHYRFDASRVDEDILAAWQD